MEPRERIRQAAWVDAKALRDAVHAAKEGEAAGQQRVAAAMVWAAFSCPHAIEPLYDVLSAAWLGAEVPEIPSGMPQAPLEASFWAAFFAVVDDAEQGYDAASITARVAALGGAVHPSFRELAEDCARRHPGAAAALTDPVPGRTDLDELGSCGDQTLGKTLYRMIVDQGYDLEVLDREAIALGALPRSLRYLNTRILQMHDVWHLVAGYQTTATHEIAISAFQLAQFGHNYPAMFLATITAITCSSRRMQDAGQRAGFGVLMQLIAEGWRHGREAPAFMDIRWESEWDRSIEAIRESHGIPIYRSISAAEPVRGGGVRFGASVGGQSALRCQRGNARNAPSCRPVSSRISVAYWLRLPAWPDSKPKAWMRSDAPVAVWRSTPDWTAARKLSKSVPW